MFEAEHLPTEGWIVEIGRQTYLKAIDTELASDHRRLVEIHAERPLRRDEFDKWTAVFGNYNTLAARRGGGSFGEASFGLAYRQFHRTSPVAPTSVARLQR
jgi:hypothetical protein